MGIVFQPGGRAIGVNGQQDQIASADVFFCQSTLDRAGKLGKGQHGLVPDTDIYGVTGKGVGSCQRTADEAKT